MGSGAAFEVFADLDRTKRRRNKRTPFDKSLHYYKDEGIKNVFPKATEIQLEAIRKKLQKQQRSDTIKTIISFTIAIPIFMCILFVIVYFFTS